MPYLAASCTSLLWDDPSLAGRTVVALPSWGADCRAEPSGLACPVSAGGPSPGTIAWNRLVLVSFDAASGGYRLLPSISAAGGAYRPEALVRPAAPAARSRELLGGP